MFVVCLWIGFVTICCLIEWWTSMGDVVWSQPWKSITEFGWSALAWMRTFWDKL